jgi:hypothetical protein
MDLLVALTNHNWWQETLEKNWWQQKHVREGTKQQQDTLINQVYCRTLSRRTEFDFYIQPVNQAMTLTVIIKVDEPYGKTMKQMQFREPRQGAKYELNSQRAVCSNNLI